jgi:DNA repair exonuclease SbcCD ATPase subunit
MAIFENADLSAVGTATAGTLATVWIGRIFWRRLVRDGTEVAKDRAEVNIISTLQAELEKLKEENRSLREKESETSLRLGRLEAKDAEAEEYKILIEKLRLKLDEKDTKIEKLIREHSTETGALTAKLEMKTEEMKNLQLRIHDLETRLQRDEKLMRCPGCGSSLV